MTYQEFSDVNVSQGFQTVFVYTNDVTGGLFMNLLLFALFIITFLGSFFASKKLSGQGDMAASFAAAGFFVAGAAIILSIVPNLINPFSVIVSIAVAILGAIWLYLSRAGE